MSRQCHDQLNSSASQLIYTHYTIRLTARKSSTQTTWKLEPEIHRCHGCVWVCWENEAASECHRRWSSALGKPTHKKPNELEPSENVKQWIASKVHQPSNVQIARQEMHCTGANTCIVFDIESIQQSPNISPIWFHNCPAFQNNPGYDTEPL